MTIKKCCENCIMHTNEYQDEYCYVCKHETGNYDAFIPKEKIIRQDEIKKAIQLIENIKNSKVDLKKFNYKEVCDLIILELKMSLIESEK